ELLVAECGEGLILPDAGVVDQNVGHAQLRLDALEQRPHAGRVGDVQLADQAAAARLADLFGSLLRILFVTAPGDDHRRPPRAKARTMAWPMPESEPVSMAILPLSLPMETSAVRGFHWDRPGLRECRPFVRRGARTCPAGVALLKAPQREDPAMAALSATPDCCWNASAPPSDLQRLSGISE